MESNNVINGARKRYSSDEIIKLLEEYEKSEGVSVKEYCEMLGVSDATFYSWQKRYGGMGEKESEFIPLEITHEPERLTGLQMEVKIIKLYGDISAEQFKTLLS